MASIEKKHLAILFLFTLIVAFFCSKMSPFYPIQEWSDVNLYFNIGKAIMNGQVLYVDVFDHKGPLIFFIYGIGSLISRTSFLGVFFLQCLTWYLIALFCYRIALLQFKSLLSLIISCIFICIFTSHTSQGGSAEEFVTCCMMISLFLFIRFFNKASTDHLKQKKDFFVHGLLFGIVLLIKFNLCVFWLFPCLAIFIICIQQQNIKYSICLILSFILGVLLIILPISLYFIYHNGVSEAMDAYIYVNANQKLDISHTIHRIFISFYQRLRFEFVEFTIILLGAFIYPFLMFRNYIAKLSLPLSFFVLFAAVFAGGYVYYYSIPYYIYAALGIIVIVYILNYFVSLAQLPVWFAAILLIIALSFSVYRKHLFNKYDDQQQNNVITTFLPYIQNEKDRSLINLSLDESNALFTYANIMPTEKFFITPNLSNDRFPDLRQAQTRYIINKKTNFIVFSEYTNNACFFDNFAPLKENYEVVATYEEYYEWQKVNRKIYLYKRKTNE